MYLCADAIENQQRLSGLGRTVGSVSLAEIGHSLLVSDSIELDIGLEKDSKLIS